jgi:hypothetical protein
MLRDQPPAEMKAPANENDPEFAEDLLRGGEAVAQFLGIKRRALFHLKATSKIPVFKLGGVICARKSVLLRWIADQEARYAAVGSKA